MRICSRRCGPPILHIIGKDIVRFHAVIWPALLMAAGEEVPGTVFGHGHLHVGGEKMSKSRGTGVHPLELVDVFGTDSYRYYFMRQFQFGADGDYSIESMTDRHNADLANGLGNLASRVLAMLASSCDGVVPEPTEEGAASVLPEVVASAAARYDEHVLAIALQPALDDVWSIVDRANGYLVEKAPWKLAKDPERRSEMESVLYASAELLRYARRAGPTDHAERGAAAVGPAGSRRHRGRSAAPRRRAVGAAGARHGDDEG